MDRGVISILGTEKLYRFIKPAFYGTFLGIAPSLELVACCRELHHWCQSYANLHSGGLLDSPCTPFEAHVANKQQQGKAHVTNINMCMLWSA